VSDGTFANVMSAISQSIRFKFGGFWRQLFQRPARRGAAAPAAPAPAAVAAPPLAPSCQPNVNGVTISLPAVLATFPLELRSKILPVDTRDLTLTVPFEKVFPELARGVVKMTFGEIRRTAPQVFAPGLESDAAQVVLPLNEILSRLDPALLVRRPTQKKPLALPEEISSPFAGRGQGLTLGVRKTRPASAAGESGKPPIFARKPGSPAAPAAPLTPPSPREIAHAAPRSLGAEGISRGEPISFKLPGDDDRPPFVRKPARLAPDATPPPPLTPQPPTPPTAWPPRSKDYLASPPVARAMQPVRSANGTPSSADAAVLLAPLTAFAEAWPEALRQEMVQLNLVNAQLAMPVELIEAALKRGRVTFPWKTLRSWICPAAPPGDSTHDATELELPLRVVAPLFLARLKGAGKPQRVTVDETIPDLFFGLPKPEPAPPPKPPDTNFYTWDENSDTPRMEDVESKRRKPPGTDFVAKPVPPNEIVSRAAALEGVVGVLIALPDGLLVAGRIPPEFNADTLAAFLPQIFSKVSQATKELRQGELNNLNFTVGNVPWKIFRVNALLFAAFGRAGGPLPTGELAQLATELDRRR